MEKFKWDILDHPPYSPDLAPSDFHLFLHLKKHPAGKKFHDDDEVQEEVMTWFKGLAADFFDSGIQKLVPRLNKCLDNAGAQNSIEVDADTKESTRKTEEKLDGRNKEGHERKKPK